MAQDPHNSSNPFTLSSVQRAEFADRGVIKLAGLIPLETVRRARETVQTQLAKIGLWRDGAWRLDALPRPQWPANGLKVGRKIGHGHPELAALIETPDLLAVVDGLLEGRPFDRTPPGARIADGAVYPQVLFTLPNIVVWRLPQGWHTDSPRLASGRAPGAQAFAFLDQVDPQGGGTLIAAGSHRFANEAGTTLRLDEIGRRLKRERFFRELMAGRGGEGGGLPKARVGEVLVEVVELTGAPGDVWLTDLRVLHCASPNASQRPRMMATYRFTRADVVGEIAAAYGRTPRRQDMSLDNGHYDE